MAVSRLRLLLCVVVAMLSPALAGAQAPPVSIAIGERGVTLDARDATLREILDEWARVGSVKIVNGEKLDDKHITLQLTDVPEREAFEILLRDLGGFVLSARGTNDSGRSEFGSLLVIPASGPLPPGNPVQSSAPSAAVTEAVTASDAAQETDPQPLILRLPGDRAGSPNAGANGRALGRGVQAAGTTSADLPEDLVDATADEKLLPPEQRPPTPILRPSEAPDAANPFGKVSGSTTPGTIAPNGPPPGFVYPPTTNPNIENVPTR